MIEKRVNTIMFTIIALLLINCGGDDKPLAERVLDHENNLKTISDSIRTATMKIDSLLIKK